MRSAVVDTRVVPRIGWWLALAAVIATGLILNWGIAVLALVMVFVQIARPLDFLASFLMVVGGAAFVFNEAGMTAQLGLLTIAILVMLGCYVLWMGRSSLSLAKARLSVPLLAFLVWTCLNAVRGVLTGAPTKHVGLELVPLLGLGCALLVANTFEARRDLRPTIWFLIAIGYGVAIWGFIVFSMTRAHVIGFYSMAIPGLVGLMLVNRALRSTTLIAILGWVALSIPLFVHQFVTFGRGLWTGCFAGLLLSAAMFAGLGRGSGVRWRRVALVVAMLAGFAAFGAVQAAVLLGQGDLLTEAWTRLSSITSVESGGATRSNVIRLFEYAKAIEFIRQSPLIGHGVGFTFSVKDPFSEITESQWGVHQNFLLIWLKQGLIGLALFLWMLWTAIALGVRESRRRTDPWEATWFATTAAATFFLVVFSLSNFPFSRVNETFCLATLWGGAMGMTRTGRVTLRWSPEPSDDRGKAA